MFSYLSRILYRFQSAPMRKLALAALAALVLAVLQFSRADRFAATTSVIFFLLFVAVYPLLRISDADGLWMTVLYVLLLGYVIALMVRSRPSGDDPTETRPLPAG